MAHRLPAAGIKSELSDTFRFNTVQPPIKPCCKQPSPGPLCTIRPKYHCRPNQTVYDDSHLHKQSPMQACAHLLPPAGADPILPEYFRFYRVIPSEKLRRKELKDAMAKGVCYNDGTQTCCPQEEETDCRPRPPLTNPGLLCNDDHDCCHKKLRFTSIAMTHPSGIFAASKEQGLADFKKWAATLPQPARVQMCHAEETLPAIPRKLICPPVPAERTLNNHPKKVDALSRWREMRMKDHWYPNLQRLESKFVKRSASIKSESSKAHMSNTSSIGLVKNN